MPARLGYPAVQISLVCAAALSFLFSVPVCGQADAYRKIESEWIENQWRFRRIECAEDLAELEALKARLASTVDGGRLYSGDLADFLCLECLMDVSIEEYRLFDSDDPNPASILPTGSVVDRAFAFRDSVPGRDKQAALRYLHRLADAIEKASPASPWGDKRKLKHAIERAAEFAERADCDLGLLASQSPPDDREGWSAVRGRLGAACEGFVAALRKLEPAAADASKASRSAMRERRMDFVLRRIYLADYDSKELLRRGARFFLESEREINEQAKRIDPAKTWKEIAREIEEDHPPRDGVVEFAKSAAMEAMEFVAARGLATLTDEARNIEVRPGDADGPLPYAHYAPRHGDARAAFVVVPCGKDWSDAKAAEHLRGNNRCWVRIVALHEAVPGHHLQFTNAAATGSRVRGGMNNPAHMEGWALYCEEMMARHWFYDPRTRLTQLRMKLWRAARVLLSTGLNHLGLTKAGAETFLTERILSMEVHAGKEVSNYGDRPHYFVAYAVGFWQIEELRKSMQEKWGGEYTDRRFHNEFLSLGPIPVPIARKIMERGN